LQGGGAHGAFTWGVLTDFSMMNALKLKGIVGTSAGAVNAAILACGLEQADVKSSGTAGQFGHSIQKNSQCSPFQPTICDKLFGSKGSMEFSPYWQAFDTLSRMLSPYQWNPNNTNVLKILLEELIDFPLLQEARNIKLFICATNVLTGRLKFSKIGK